MKIDTLIEFILITTVSCAIGYVFLQLIMKGQHVADGIAMTILGG